MKMKNRMLALAAGTAIAAGTVIGCGSSREQFVFTGTGNVVPTPTPTVSPTVSPSPTPTLPAVGTQPIFALVSNNADSNRGELDVFNRLFAAVISGTSGNNEGLAFDSLQNFAHAGDVGAPGTPGSLRTFARIFDRASADFNTTFDRILGGAGTTLTGLVNPKGFTTAQTAGYNIVADFGASNLAIFGTAAGGDAAPVAVTPLAEKPWDVAYDEVNDRLYVAGTAGNILVFDDYIGGGFAQPVAPATTAAPTRTMDITVNASNEFRNMHGIAFDSTRNALIVSDVGAASDAQAADFATDGRLYVIRNAATASGNVVPDIVIQGAATQLGNPVDVDLNGVDVRVAEKAGGKLLIFPQIFTSPGGNVQPTVSVAEAGPESVATASATFVPPTDLSDRTSPTGLTGIIASLNPMAPGADRLNLRSLDLSVLQGTFDPTGTLNTIDIESVKTDSRGDVYATFDGGVAVLNRVASNRRDGQGFTVSRDRTITGAATALVSPKGLDVVESRNWVVVADFGTDGNTSAVRVFSKEAGGNAAPIFSTPTPVGTRAWDVDYDSVNDKLYVALTNGTIAVYDAYGGTTAAPSTPATATPDRIIVPATATGVGGVKISDNLHGIAYDELTNTLFVSDVGALTVPADPGFDTDGSLYVFENAAQAGGGAASDARFVAPDVVIEGADTLLGNPVDVEYDGVNLYVAEKANGGGQILRFDAIRGIVVVNQPPTLTQAAPAVESVSLNAQTIVVTP